MTRFLRRRDGWTTTRLTGGLGNQLFQYAAGRAVAKRTRTRLRLDATATAIEHDRPYALGDFRIRAELAGGKPKAASETDDAPAERRYAAERWGATLVLDPHLAWSDTLDRAGPDSYLAGWWLSERYFASVIPQVRRELRPRLTAEAEQMRRRIVSRRSAVALHVRRGDFIASAAHERVFNVCDADYFHRAADHVADLLPDAEFFVFSDDPDWCREQLDLPAPTEIVAGRFGAVDDLALIAACGNAVISNSTFAFWGAWLGERRGSVVVGPSRWLNQPDQPDIMPRRWQQSQVSAAAPV